jgi:hypothetical protein
MAAAGPGLFDFSLNIGNIPTRRPYTTLNKDVCSGVCGKMAEFPSIGDNLE